MKVPFFSIRTGILTNLTFLIISAMLLINAVVIKFFERDLIQARVKEGQLLARSLGCTIGIRLEKYSWNLLKTDTSLYQHFTKILRGGHYSAVIATDLSGKEIFSISMPGADTAIMSAYSREAIISKGMTFNFTGSTWGVIWTAPKNLVVSSPVLLNGQLLGGLTIYSDLTDIYERLRNTEKIILLYIFLNTIILLVVGHYMLSRTIVTPLHRLLKTAEKFQAGQDITFPTEDTSNEIGRLSRSLNMMLKKLDENKKDLEAHIESLEKANQEIKRTQEEIIRSEKLASVGRLATGIAHEIGNPIGIVIGYLELLKQDDLTVEEKKDFLQRSESEITRINGIIRQLLDFSRAPKGEKQKVKAHEIIEETLVILQPQPIMSQIEITTQFRAKKDILLADPNQLKQVFLNVLLNAADAIEEKGKSSENPIHGQIQIRTSNEGKTLRIEFMDNGCGISQRNLHHIFDPFYTTKAPGKGTGLGLSVSYKLIEDLGGSIQVQSSLGQGTQVVITIPLCNACSTKDSN